MPELSPVERYLELGLRLDHHVDGFIDAYYGPPEVAARVRAEPAHPPAALVADAARLIADLDGGAGEPELGADRRRWLRAHTVGLHTSARKLAGEDISYEDEVELCYGVRPQRWPIDEFEAAHRRLDQVLPGTGALGERFVAWREAQAIDPAKLPASSTRWPRTCGSAPTGCSGCPTASTSTGSW